MLSRTVVLALLTAAVLAVAVTRPGGWVGTGLVLTVLLTAGAVVAGRSPTGTAPRRPGPAPAALVDPRARWEQATQQHDGVLSAYGAYELDPAMLLRYPALWDLTAPAVIDFHDALELAGSLRTDEYPGPEAAEEYLGAVAMLRSDWATADRYARSTGTGGLGDVDAGACRKALALLQHARGTSGPERATYLERVIGAMDTLAERGVVTAPAPMQQALRAEVRRAIEA